MPPNYKLTYFNFRARAEVARLLFAVAEVGYEDQRIIEEDWLSFKQTTPNGQIPLLEVDGQVFCQSYAMQRFLARQFGLAGKTALDQFRADMIVDTAEDLYKAIIPAYELREDNHDEKATAEFVSKFQEKKLPTALLNLENMLIGKKGWFSVGNELTWADLNLVNTMDWIEDNHMVVDWTKYPKLAALRKRVLSIPKIAAWVEKRPKTIY